MFANLSIKSNQPAPMIGRIKAVQNPQKAAHSKTQLIGLNRMIAATTTSDKPTNKIKVPAVSRCAPVKAHHNHSAQQRDSLK